MRILSHRWPRPTLQPTALLVLLVLALALCVACTSGALGDVCDAEGGCPFGTRCLHPPGHLEGVCTVRCDQTCADGACIETDQGALCARPCSEAGTCPGEQRCQLQIGGDVQVCWGPDSHLTPIADEPLPISDQPGFVDIVRVDVREDENGDGVANPGELVRYSVVVSNPGNTPVVNAIPDATLRAGGLLTRCFSGGGSYCSESTEAACMCGEGYSSHSVYVEPGEPGRLALDVEVQIAQDASVVVLNVTFTGEQGEQWGGEVSLPVSPLAAHLELASATIVTVDGDRPSLARGGSGSLEVAVVNTGTSTALEVWAEATVGPALQVTGCLTGSSYCSGRTDQSCNCGEDNTTARYHLEAGETQERVLRVGVDVPTDAAIGDTRVDVVFHDGFGNSWPAAFDVEVTP